MRLTGRFLRLPFSVLLRCAAGSEVVRCTSNPMSASLTAIAAAIVVLPTPPLPINIIRPCSLRAISSTRPESDKFSGVYWMFVTGSGNASEPVSSSPFKAETPTILTGCSNRVSVGSSDKPAGRFASASCSRCHIAAARASCSASALGSTPLITRYWFFRPIAASSSWVRATSCSVDFCSRATRTRRVRSGSDNASTA